jgi:hypothetical protein
MCLFQIVVRLQAEPESLTGTQSGGQAHRRIRRDTALAEHDLVDTAWRHTASAFWLVPMGVRNSSSNTSPGWTLGGLFMIDSLATGFSS